MTTTASAPSPSPAPRVLHLLVRRSGGGTERNVRRLCENVPGFRFFALEDALGFPLNWRRLYKARALLRRQKFDAVFCYGASAHLAALLMFPPTMPLVGNIRCESDFAGSKGTLQRLIRWRFRGWVSNSRRALAGDDGIVIHNGIPAPPEEAPLLRDLPQPVLGVLARGHEKKGHRFAFDAWQKAGKPGTLVFAGELPNALRAEAEGAGVVCTGHVAAGPLLRSLDLLLIPSDAEGIPTVLLEALARGVPVLSTPVGGVEEVVQDGVHCRILERGAWVEFLSRLDMDEMNRLAAEGQRHILSVYTFENMAEQFIAAARKFSRRRE